jgi:hypothetical protein
MANTGALIGSSRPRLRAEYLGARAKQAGSAAQGVPLVRFFTCAWCNQDVIVCAMGFLDCGAVSLYTVC